MIYGMEDSISRLSILELNACISFRIFKRTPEEVPAPFATNMDQAWVVMEFFKKIGFWPKVERTIAELDGWRCWVSEGIPEGWQVTAFGETAPKAIARAACAVSYRIANQTFDRVLETIHA